MTDRADISSMRERLVDKSFLTNLPEQARSGVSLRSDEELVATLEKMLAGHDPGHDLYVFGCGSLMWNPAMIFSEKSVGKVFGWHRAFCLKLLFGRGSPEQPGAMLALDRGGACIGVVYRIDASHVSTEVPLLWRREMLAGSYQARWMLVHTADKTVRAIGFTVDRSHERYLAQATPEVVASLIRSGRGSLGTTLDYFEKLQQALHALGVEDRGIARLEATLRNVRITSKAGLGA